MMFAQAQVSRPPYKAYPYHTPHFSPPDATSLTKYHHQHLQQHYQPSVHQSHSSNHTKSNANPYMNPIFPQPPPHHQLTFHSSPHHGTKRSAPEGGDEFERSCHISNHFKKLRLGNNRNDIHNSTLTPSNLEPYTTAPSPATQDQHASPYPIQPQTSQANQLPAPKPTHPTSDLMTIDETPNKIYIHDLDSEVASIEAAERNTSQLFLPDFEKRIGAIPDHILRSKRPVDNALESESQALVLYKEPTSLSVPEEEDAVRAAVLEARRGIRERLRREQQRERESAHVFLDRSLPGSIDRDEDAMDFD